MEPVTAVIGKIGKVSIEGSSKTLRDGRCGILYLGDLFQVVNSRFGGPTPFMGEASELQLPRSHDLTK